MTENMTVVVLHLGTCVLINKDNSSLSGTVAIKAKLIIVCVSLSVHKITVNRFTPKSNIYLYYSMIHRNFYFGFQVF